MKDRLEFPFYALPKGLAARKDLQASDKVVFSVIRDCLGDNGTSWPGMRMLSKTTGLSVSTVAESVKRLEARKVLKVKRQGKGKSSHYSILKSVLKSEQSGDKAHRKPNTGVPKTGTEAHRKSVQNYKDSLNQTTTSNSFSFMLGSKKLWHLNQIKLDEYTEAFPNLDIGAELRKAAQWLNDNPGRRKTAKGMNRFLGGWLGRAKPKSEPQQSDLTTREATDADVADLIREGILT